MPKVNRHLPPIWALPDMFQDMAQKALEHGLRDALKTFGGRAIRVATMCSGTESPIIALELIGEALKSMGFDFAFEHMFSAEITPFKQAFIQRNLNPPILFRDVCQIKLGQEAETVFGASRPPPPPGEVQILVAGFACVDFSNLNTAKRTFEFDPERNGRPTGESGATFSAIINYARDFRPQIVIVENIMNAKWNLQVQEWNKIEYAAEYVILDSKNYYLPQTRSRGYMICVNFHPDTSALSEEQARVASKRWMAIVKALSRPASSPIESFLLKPNNPLLQLALTPLGDTRARTSDWSLCKDRHRIYRQTKGLGNGTPYTNWVSGQPVFPAYIDKSWMSLQPHRVHDTLDIIKLSNAVSDRDIEHKATIIDLSQNVDRGLDTVSPGLTGCITPSGIPYSTILGRSLVGLEALSLQGLPMGRIHLSSESQKQLKDLAGNAMTSTVVGAALVAAFAALSNALRFRTDDSRERDGLARIPMKDQAKEMAEEHNHRSVPGMCLKAWCQFGALEIMNVAQLVRLAGRTLQYCSCEGQHKISSATIMKCQDCQATVCRPCSGIPRHNLAPFTPAAPRIAPSEFSEAISRSLPTRLHVNIHPHLFSETGEVEHCSPTVPLEALHKRLEECLGQELHLHSWQRSTSWMITYSSSGLSLILEINGVSAEWSLFARALESEPGNSKLRRVFNRPIARMRVKEDAPDVLTGSWEICLPYAKECVARVYGDGDLVPSWRNELGLIQFANENVWSGLVIDGSEIDAKDPRMDIDGLWELLPLCGTSNRALHRRISNTLNSPEQKFLIFLPQPYDDGIDTMSITPNISRLNIGDYRDVHGVLYTATKNESQEKPTSRKAKNNAPDLFEHRSWKPSSTNNESVLYRVTGHWVPCPSAFLSVPSAMDGIGKITFLATNPIVKDFSGHCSNHALQLLKCEFPWLDRNPIGALQTGTWIVTEDNQHQMSLDLKWLVKRIPFHSDGEASQWVDFHLGGSGIKCATCAPPRPEIRWRLKASNARVSPDSKGMVPYEDGVQAGTFEKAWKVRPSPILLEISIVEDLGKQDPLGTVVITLNSKSLVHRTAATMPSRPDAGPTKASWRLVVKFDPYELPQRPKYYIPSNKSGEPHFFTFLGTAGSDGVPFHLRREQARSLQWMLRRDQLSVPVYHEEVLEESTNCHLNWKLEAKASRSRLIRGGVLADQVGYGKTVLIIALAKVTLHNSVFETTRMAEDPGSTAFPIPIKATCVITPPTLVSQWTNEVKRFWPNCKILTINTPADLAEQTISDMKGAEMIIVSASLLLHAHNLERLAELAGLPQPTHTQKAREFQAWLSTALRRLEKNILRLLENGTSGFAAYLQTLYEEYDGDWAAYNLTPSKRYRGEAFQKQQKATQLEALAKPVKLETVPPARREVKGFDGESSENATGVVLDMFRFHRKVVDEQTYISKIQLQAISALHSRSSWILSATAALEDFADVQRLAGFLDVHLGVEDSTSSVTSSRNIANIRAEQTKFEEFESLQRSHTASWHRFRNDSAQKFLNVFARRNVVEHTEIPAVEHYIPVRLDATHQIICAATQSQYLRGNTWPAKDVEMYEPAGRQYLKTLSALFQTGTRHETLCRLANYNPWVEGSGRVSVRDQLLRMLENLHALEKEVHKRLGDSLADLAVKRGVMRHDGMEKWSAIFGTARSGGFGDKWTSAVVLQLGSRSMETKSQADVFYQLALQRVNGSDTLPWKAMQTSIRQGVARVRDHADALVRTRQAINVLASAARLQRYICGGYQSTSVNADCGCDVHDTGNLLISARCGHSCCRRCYLSHLLCGAEGCNAFLQDNCMILPHQLAPSAPSDVTYGSKIDTLIRIIQTIREDDSVIVFSQYDSVTSRISAAFSAVGIRHISVRETGSSAHMIKRAQKDLEAFKSNAQTGDFVKAAILNPADATAAGHNLTNASTVVFVSPVITHSDQAFHDAYMQAIGRARRYGQKHTVHVYHLITLQTYEVDIIERRHHVKLQLEKQGNGEALAKRVSHDAHGEGCTGECCVDLGSWVFRCVEEANDE